MTATASTAPVNSSKTYLMHWSGTKYEKLVDIKNSPDEGSKPEKLDCTSLSSTRKEYTQGLIDTEDWEFKCNYVPADYTKCKATCDDKLHYYAIYYGEDGVDGITYISGYPYCFRNGSEVNAIREMTYGVTVFQMSDTDLHNAG